MATQKEINGLRDKLDLLIDKKIALEKREIISSNEEEKFSLKYQIKDLEKDIAGLKKKLNLPAESSIEVSVIGVVHYLDNQSDFLAYLKKLSANEVVVCIRNEDLPKELRREIRGIHLELDDALEDGEPVTVLTEIKNRLITKFENFIRAKAEKDIEKERSRFLQCRAKIDAIKDNWEQVIPACDFIASVALSLEMSDIEDEALKIKYRPTRGRRNNTALKQQIDNGFVDQDDVTTAKDDLNRLLGKMSSAFEQKNLKRQ